MAKAFSILVGAARPYTRARAAGPGLGRTKQPDGGTPHPVSWRGWCFLGLVMAFMPTLGASVITFGDQSSAIKIASGATLRVQTRLDVGGGQIIKDPGGVIVGATVESRVAFDGGVYTTTGRSMIITGNFDPAGSQAIELNGSKTFLAEAGTHVESFNVTGSGNRLEGQPRFDGPITLLDSNTTLTMAVQSRVNQNIVLGGGSIVLEDDLKFSEGKQFIGSGDVYVGGHDVTFSGSDLLVTSTINWYDAKAVSFEDRLVLSSLWSFKKNTTLYGHGNVLQFAPGGIIRIQDGYTLDIVGMAIRGLGTGAFQFGSTTDKIRFVNVTIELDNNYTFNDGIIYTDGPLKFILENHNLTFAGISSFSIDSVMVTYEDLYKGGTISPVHHDGVHLTLLNGGRLESTKYEVATFDHGPSQLYFSTNTTMSYDLNLSSGHKLYLKGNLVLDGAGYAINCDRSAGAIMALDPGVSVTMENLLIDGLKPSHIQMGAGSHLSFGNGSRVRLFEDTDLTVTWTFAGNSSLYGPDVRLTLGSNGGLYVLNNGIVTLQGLTIAGVQNNRIACQSNYASLAFHDLSLVLSNHFTFSTGSFAVTGDSTIQGPYTFAYSTVMGSTINSNARLRVDRNVTFAYRPSAAFKNLLIMTDATSRLRLDGCTLDISSTGLQLTKGTVVVSNQNYVQSAATHREEAFILGDGNGANDVDVEIEAGGDLQLLAGIMVYKNTLG